MTLYVDENVTGRRTLVPPRKHVVPDDCLIGAAYWPSVQLVAARPGL
jgi:hypothetical protein